MAATGFSPSASSLAGKILEKLPGGANFKYLGLQLERHAPRSGIFGDAHFVRLLANRELFFKVLEERTETALCALCSKTEWVLADSGFINLDVDASISRETFSTSYHCPGATIARR